MIVSWCWPRHPRARIGCCSTGLPRCPRSAWDQLRSKSRSSRWASPSAPGTAPSAAVSSATRRSAKWRGCLGRSAHPVQPRRQPQLHAPGRDVNPSNASTSYPVFLDPAIDRQPDPRTYWTLGKLARYILAVYNDQTYVKNPDFTNLDAMLQVRAPVSGSGFVNPDDASHYTASDVVIRDFDATNLAWPDALLLQLGYAGFGMRFVTSEDGGGEPRHELEIYRKDGGEQDSPRDLELPETGSNLDPARCNVSMLHLVRDSRSIVNAITVETQERRVEVSLVLAPGFTPLAGDETAAKRSQFLRANLSTASGDVRRKYRYYVADEAGDGHYDVPTTSWLTSALDLSPIFPSDEQGKLTYVRRLRPGGRARCSLSIHAANR